MAEWMCCLSEDIISDTLHQTALKHMSHKFFAWHSPCESSAVEREVIPFCLTDEFNPSRIEKLMFLHTWTHKLFMQVLLPLEVLQPLPSFLWPLDFYKCTNKISLSNQVEGEELVDLLRLHDSVYEQANSWFTSLKDNMKSQILSHFGHLPSKDPDPQVWIVFDSTN